jgi:hypothetical protein
MGLKGDRGCVVNSAALLPISQGLRPRLALRSLRGSLLRAY